MLPPPLAQVVDKKSVSPSGEAHLKCQTYGRVPAMQLLASSVPAGTMGPASFVPLFCALSVAASEADFRASRARERRDALIAATMLEES